MRERQMRKKKERLVACPISCSSNNDEYNDICKATGGLCPYFVDEGMSVCKSKAKCLAYFAKKGSKVNWQEVAKLISTDTKSALGRKNKYTNTIKRDKNMLDAELHKAKEENNLFIEGLEDALKNHEDVLLADNQDDDAIEDYIMAIEESMKKM